jgi:PAS domain S-box-containing protein
VKVASRAKQPAINGESTKHRSIIIILFLEIGILLLAGLLGFLFQNGLFFLLASFLLIGITIYSYRASHFYPASKQSSLYEALFNQTNDAVFILDLQGNHLRVNQRAATLFGYTVEELLSMSFRQMVDPAELAASESVLEKLLAGEKLSVYERTFVSKSGEKIPVEINVQIVRDNQGQPLHIQSIVRDIRQRKQGENAQTYTQELLRTLVSALPDRAVILDRKGFYRDVLNTADMHPAIPSNEVIGKHVSEITNSEFANFCISMIEKTLESNSLQIFEYDYGFPDSVRSFDGRTIPYYDPRADEKLVFWVTRDITERKAAAKVLMESEQRLRTFARALPDRAIILDANGYYREILKENYDNEGLRILNVRGKRLQDLYTQDFVDFCLNKIRETLEHNQPLAIDYALEVDGITYYLDGRIVPIRDAETGDPCVIWISRDISRLKHAELALKYHNRLHSLLTEVATEFVNLPLERLDASIQKMLQQVGEFIEADRSYINIISPDLRETNIAYEWYAPNIQHIIDSKRIKNISTHRWSMNKFLQFETVSIPSVEKLPPEAFEEQKSLQAINVKSVLSIPLIKNGKLIGTLGFHAISKEKVWTEDTSDLLKIVAEIYVNALQRKATEEALSDSEKRMRLLIGSLPDRAVIFDREGRYYEILKPEFETDYMPPEVRQIREGQSLYDYYSPEFIAFCLEKIRETLDSNRTQVFEYESPLRGKNFQMEARTIPFRDPLTKEERVFWVTRDISERIEAEKQRVELLLEREKIDFLRQFVDSVTHDLKTPITVIGTSLHLIERSQDAEKRQERMITIRKQLATLSHMVDELLAVARLDEIPQLQLTSMDFYEVLRDVIDFLTPKAELKQIKLSMNLPESRPIILASYDELSRAISNLIDNAIKYTPNSGAVTISVYLEEAQLIFEVQDTGIGISSDDIEHVFERFFRADRARKEAPGTGLGLEITRRIVELHGGKIKLESKINQGTTFKVWLPLKIDEASQLEYEQ